MDVGEAEAVLGVPVATPEGALRKRYKTLALSAHPDKGGSPEAFQRLADAYAKLLEAKKRTGGGGGDGGVDARAVFASVYTFSAQHGITKSKLERLSARVELTAAELRGSLEHPSLEGWVLVDARRDAEVEAAGAFPGSVALSEGARGKMELVRLPAASCVDADGAVLFDGRHGPTPKAVARLDGAGRAGLERVAAAALSGSRVLVFSQTATRVSYERTDCQVVAFFLRNSRALPRTCDPKRLRLGFFAWGSLAAEGAPPPPPPTRPRRVVSRGALVRRAAALESALLADLPRGAIVDVVEAATVGGDPVLDADGEPVLDAAGAPARSAIRSRVRIAAPLDGWMSEKQLEDAPAPPPPPNPPTPASEAPPAPSTTRVA